MRSPTYREIYAFGNYAQTEGRYRFFYREGDQPVSGLDGTLVALRDDFGYDGELIATGYTPFLDGEQEDYSLVGGLRGNWRMTSIMTSALGYGYNELDYTLNNTTNSSLALARDGEPAANGLRSG